MTNSDKPAYKTIAKNKRAFHDYHIEDTLEAGIVLTGTEIKSVRAGRVNITDSFVIISDTREAWAVDMQISPYAQGNRFNVPEKRQRKLLLHQREIHRLAAAINQKGYTVVGLELYFKDDLVKFKIGIAKGKHDYDRRDDIKNRDAARELDRIKKGGNIRE
ncbi:SsrA-binding protein SmpB [Candidatus Sumerlaeota bacterium]|nr:SsrA-binding protein SmpB [Candidatus Sumerlaeales bacterium]NLD62085.1 SsrA-binding protein SmpB [Candidatus Sumerlaeota bacterium]